MMKALLTAEISADHLDGLERLVDIEYAGWVREQRILSEEEMTRLVRDKDILITSYDPVTKAVIEAGPNLKLIVCTRANPVNIDTSYARSKNIQVSYAPGRNSVCTAEFTVAMMMSVMRRIPQAYAALHNGLHLAEARAESATKDGLRSDVTWALAGDTPYVLYKGDQMAGRTLGIIGYGDIGRRVGRICAHGFGMKILVSDPFVSPDSLEEGVTLADFNLVLENSDVITVHCKDTPETRRLINREAFKRMKKTAYFINTSRGALVDEAALIEALLGREIAGAAVDVFESEPITRDHPFITKCDNIVITPHLAGATHDAIINHTKQLVTDVKHFLNHEPLEYNYVCG